MLGHLGHDHAVIAPGPVDATGTHGNASEAPGARPALSAAKESRVIRIAGAALPYDATYHLLTRFDKLRAILREEGPDVLEAHSPYLAAAGAVLVGKGAARALTAFWHADHVKAYVEPAIGRLCGRRAAGALGARLWRAVAGLLAPFDATFVAGRGQAQMLRTAGVSPVFHVPFGVDVSTFRPRPPGANRDECRRAVLAGLPGEVGADLSGALLVGVGRFAFEKRWDIVLDAFARVRSRRSARLVLFGDGPERRRLEARAPAGVTFAGFERDRARLASALASADVLVHGCPCETYGLGVVEAVASGLPVVVPDEGGAAESADFGCAESYSSLDPEACAAAIERLLDRDRATLDARARDAAARVPTLEQHFSAVLAVYDDLLAR